MFLHESLGCVGDGPFSHRKGRSLTLQCTVIVPTYRRPWLLRRCLKALAKQTLDPTSFEVIVADDDANDRLRQIIKAFSRQAI